jgi:hypothetical protein
MSEVNGGELTAYEEVVKILEDDGEGENGAAMASKDIAEGQDPD